ncbi:MAG: hypothetical protein CSA82_00170 [Actinobacteria bacterium]|nr:MAG: hypothetical protein CSA82_00170 [Actinomycetota bacterium]
MRPEDVLLTLEVSKKLTREVGVMTSLIPLVRSALVISRGQSQHEVVRDQYRKGAIVRIARSIYLATDIFESSQSLWVHRRIITLARIFAVAQTKPSVHCFVRESALALYQGIVFETNPDIWVHVKKRSRLNTTVMPEVKVRGVLLSNAVKVIAVSSCDRKDATVNVAGVSVSSPTQIATDIARFSPARQAVPELSALLRQSCGYDRWRPEEYIKAAETAKKQWLEALEAEPYMRGYDRGRVLIKAASVQCDSVAEGSMLWFLYAYGVTTWRLQVPFEVRGRTYFADVVIIDAHVIIEIDGREKLGESEQDIQNNLHNMMVRENELEALGWQVVHVTARDIMFHPEKVFEHLSFVCPGIFGVSSPSAAIFRYS